jgi:hypothetical protein
MIMLCTRKVEGLRNWIYIVIFDTIAMTTIFLYCGAISDPGSST